MHMVEKEEHIGDQEEPEVERIFHQIMLFNLYHYILFQEEEVEINMISQNQPLKMLVRHLYITVRLAIMSIASYHYLITLMESENQEDILVLEEHLNLVMAEIVVIMIMRLVGTTVKVNLELKDQEAEDHVIISDNIMEEARVEQDLLLFI